MTRANRASSERDDPPTVRLSKRERRRRLRQELKDDVVQVPIYQDRTVPVGRFIIWRWLRRWVLVAVAVVVVIVGPFAGGWYFNRQRGLEEAARLRDVLYTEVEANVALLASQTQQLDALETALAAEERGVAPTLTPSFQSVRWNQVVARADLFKSETQFNEVTRFYQGLATIEGAFVSYNGAAAVWRFAAGETGRVRTAAKQNLTEAVRDLRGALSRTNTAGQTLLAGRRPDVSSLAQPIQPDDRSEAADDAPTAVSAGS